MTGDVEALNIRLNYLTRYIQHQRTEIKELEKRVRALEQQQKHARQSNSESPSAFLDSSVEDSSASSQRRRRPSPKKPAVRQKPVRPRTSPYVTMLLQYCALATKMHSAIHVSTEIAKSGVEGTKPAKRRRRHSVIPSALRIKRSSLPVRGGNVGLYVLFMSHVYKFDSPTLFTGFGMKAPIKMADFAATVFSGDRSRKSSEIIFGHYRLSWPLPFPWLSVSTTLHDRRRKVYGLGDPGDLFHLASTSHGVFVVALVYVWTYVRRREILLQSNQPMPPHVSAGTMCQYHNTIYRRSTLLIRLLKILWSPTTGFALSRTHREKSDVLLSKKLAWVLRHGAAKVGLNYTPGGFLYLDELLGLAKFRGVTETEIRHVVDNNDKRRFEMCMDPESGRMKIRAFQGHSVQISHPAHTLITIPSEFPTVLHGTYFRNWEKIRTEGLKRMGRTHIHMAADEPGDCGVISGVRANVEVLIYIDLARAMADGYRFYVTPNRVILTEGNTDGCLPPKYFKAAYQLRPQKWQLMGTREIDSQKYRGFRMLLEGDLEREQPRTEEFG
ncbi:tRNA 2'-phosphotransferase 1 [Clonorchis sinensis]|uniref:2'-phosphotransferase n=1 Tax=Clonorchis sinensis TaxID=79923 RepID=G7YIJ6_CLOSI|nr:tRNA 2'-phosphotransferase 1 [Clonorchis sinensis]